MKQVKQEQTPILTRAKAIRAKCLDCMCGSVKEVRLCPATDCPLYPYRLGHIDKGIYKNAPDAEQAEKP